jgi:hypothetical protein
VLLTLLSSLVAGAVAAGTATGVEPGLVAAGTGLAGG